MTEAKYPAELVERVTEALAGAIIDANGTIDYRLQPIAIAALSASGYAPMKEALAQSDVLLGEFAAVVCSDPEHDISLAALIELARRSNRAALKAAQGDND